MEQTSRPVTHAIFGVVLVLAFIGVLLLIANALPHQKTGTQATNQATTATTTAVSTSDKTTRRISGDNWFGCVDKGAFIKLIQYEAQGDSTAFSTALSVDLALREATMFKNGEPVYIVNAGIFSGLVQVRRYGETVEYWTAVEAVK